MAEKVVDKLKRISRDLADSVCAEIDLTHTVARLNSELKHVKQSIACYVADKEGIETLPEAISFVKGYYKAKTEETSTQIQFGFIKE